MHGPLLEGKQFRLNQSPSETFQRKNLKWNGIGLEKERERKMFRGLKTNHRFVNLTGHVLLKTIE